MESAGLNRLGDPPGSLIDVYQSILELGDSDKPLVDSLVNEGGLRPPAEWIAMLNLGLFEETISLLKVFDHVFVSILEVLALELGGFCGEEAVVVDQDTRFVGYDDAVLHADPVIVLSVGGGGVDDAGSGVGSDVGVAKHLEAAHGASIL